MTPLAITLLVARAYAACRYALGRIDRAAVLQHVVPLQAPGRSQTGRGRRAHRASGLPTGPFAVPLLVARVSVA